MVSPMMTSSAVISPSPRSLAILGILTVAGSVAGQDVGFSVDRPRMEAGQPPAVVLRLAEWCRGNPPPARHRRRTRPEAVHSPAPPRARKGADADLEWAALDG